MMLDHISKLLPVAAITPVAARTNNTAITSTALDLQGCGSASFVLLTGANTDANATFALEIQESNDDATYTAVADADLIGTEAQASFDFSKDNLTFWIGYKGSKRYLKAVVTPSGNDSGDIFLSAVWLKGHLELAPAARN
ncbi:hypothetical protein ABI_21810 [Asticcacaulis biprosthecium C19]|uniref:Uncharacterized protein n=1 Tax=Asticcacaulis biprosthecium C19 TaxID=715226 RepID=F4QGY6_9CAUL|nr:hypothetical protein [Asticcacaulis biprosthecium]EGF93739.1 hypothetical protein ABI_21810 [Asticcacaulis biprosthecium C19]